MSSIGSDCRVNAFNLGSRIGRNNSPKSTKRGKCKSAIGNNAGFPKAGIEGVEIDENNAPAVYYNLNGVEVENPVNGLFIKVQGGKASKVYVK